MTFKPSHLLLFIFLSLSPHIILSCEPSDDASFTFQVDNVPPRAGQLTFLTPDEAFHKQVGQNITLSDFSHGTNNNSQLIASDYRMSGVMKAIHAAYMNHYSLKLSVSDFIIMIGYGIAQHMEVYSEELRSQFVDFQGKEKITIETVVLDWPVIIDRFMVQISNRTKADLVDIVIDDTSVATPLSRIASEITIMDSFKQYFAYEVILICGIPNITLVGTPSDWEMLRSKVKKLEQLNTNNTLKLDWWLNELVPLVDNIVDQAVSRKADPAFWSSIYKFQDGSPYSSDPSVTGWIIKFHPYLVDFQNTLYQNKFVEVEPSTFGTGVSEVPFVLKTFETSESMVFYGGFLGAQVMEDEETIEAVYFYAVGPEPIENPEPIEP